MGFNVSYLKAKEYMETNKIKGRITAITKHGFEYMSWNGACYYVSLM